MKMKGEREKSGKSIELSTSIRPDSVCVGSERKLDHFNVCVYCAA